jgi:hypothetical protein
LALLLAGGCTRAREPAPAPPDTTHAARPVPTTRPAPRYRAIQLSGESALVDLENQLGAKRFALFLKVNRIDLAHLRDTDTLALPDSSLDTLDLSPFPLELAGVATSPKAILVSVRVQAFGAYESGRLVRWGPTSTGKKATPTPLGLYHANWKAKQRFSTVNDEWLLKWCVNIQNRDGISLHEYELPGRPASHSCVRLAADDAEWVYGWVDQWKLDAERKVVAEGTPVLIFGAYAWKEPGPWKRLGEDPGAASTTPAELDSALRVAFPPTPVAVADSAAAPMDTTTSG